MKTLTAKLIFLMMLLIVMLITNSCSKKTDNAPLTEQSIQNLIAFTKLYGYVRYFHPSSEAQKIDWEKFAIYGAGKVEQAENTNALIDSLKVLFMPIAPTLKIYATDNVPLLKPEDLVPKDTTGLKAIFWQHFMGEASIQFKELELSKRDAYSPADTIFGKLKNYPKPNEYFTAEINNEVKISMPLALYSLNDTTIPKADENKLNELITKITKLTDSSITIVNRSARFGCIIIAWNVFRHFYPYFDVVKTDWQSVLLTTLKKSAVDTDRYDFTLTIRRLISKLNDGHAILNNGGLNDDVFSPPFMWDWLENKMAITKVFEETDKDLSTGDIIIEIDGIKTIEALEKAEELISGGTLGWKRLTNIRIASNSSVISALTGKKDSNVKLKVQTVSGKIIDIQIKRSKYINFNYETYRPMIYSIKPDIQYVSLYRASMEVINNAMDSLKNAKGIIFDLRGYPLTNLEIFCHIIDAPIISERWNKPLRVFPDGKEVVFDTSGRWILIPKQPRLTSNIVFITDARAISAAETYMGLIEGYKIADIIGEHTSGTNGNICPLTLPLGYQLNWTQMKVLKHDGSQHHGIGIIPTIPCSPTIKGVLEGRDEQLEKAIEVIEKRIE